MSSPVWCLIPWVVDWPSTLQAARDVAAQTIPTKLLLIGNGVSAEDREQAECSEGWLNWFHSPPLPSLAATWNAALRFVWASGGDRAWVLNNDLKCKPQTLSALLEAFKTYPDAWFISGVNSHERYAEEPYRVDLTMRGGPDFSCYVITREGHEKYPFDENFTPAFCEDCDAHRRWMLGGDGQKIFSVDVPYLHAGSGTLKSVSPERRTEIEHAIESGSRAYYIKKWGTPENRECWRIPFDPSSAQEGITNIELFDQERQAW